MRPEVENKNKNCVYHGDCVGRDQITNIVMLQRVEEKRKSVLVSGMEGVRTSGIEWETADVR